MDKMNKLKVAYFMIVICQLNGYKCSLASTNGTLVVSKHPCSEKYTTITKNTKIAYEPMTFNDVLENEASFHQLVRNFDHVRHRISDSGQIREIPIKGCFKLIEFEPIWRETNTPNRIKELLMSSYKHLTRPFQHCINISHPNDELAGVITATCGCVPFDKSFEDTYLRKVNELHCMAYGSKSTSIDTSDIYMWVFDLTKYWHQLPDYVITSCHVLSTYITRQQQRLHYSRSGLSTYGTLCPSNRYTNKSELCHTFVENEDVSLCKLRNTTNPDKKVFECSPESQILPGQISQIYKAVENTMWRKEQTVYFVYTDKLPFLFTYKSPREGPLSYVILYREYGRIFVKTERYFHQLNFLCRKTSYKIGNHTSNGIEHHDSEKPAFPVTLTTACVGAFLLLVAILAVVLIVRKRFHQDTDSNDGDSLDSNEAIELQSIGSSHCVSVAGPKHASAAVPGPIGANPGSVAGPNHSSGAVPGRMNVCTTSQPTSYGEVPGRIDGGYNFYYSHDDLIKQN